MNCSETYKLFDSIMDCQATDAEKKHFFSHLDKCIHCFEHYELDKLFKNYIQKHETKTCCPVELITLIKKQIKNISE